MWQTSKKHRNILSSHKHSHRRQISKENNRKHRHKIICEVRVKEVFWKLKKEERQDHESRQKDRKKQNKNKFVRDNPNLVRLKRSVGTIRKLTPQERHESTKTSSIYIVVGENERED